MTYETIIYEKEGGIGIITLNRPQRLNAINYQLVMDLTAITTEVEQDEAVERRGASYVLRNPFGMAFGAKPYSWWA